MGKDAKEDMTASFWNREGTNDDDDFHLPKLQMEVIATLTPGPIFHLEGPLKMELS